MKPLKALHYAIISLIMALVIAFCVASCNELPKLCEDTAIPIANC